jgi:hypothetical protein
MFRFSSFPLSAALARVLLAFLLLAVRLPAAAQAPAWQSARAIAAAGNSSLNVTATAVDAAGNVYLAGSFVNTVLLGGTTLTSLGDWDAFVTKFNPVSNQFMWAQRAGGTGTDHATTLAVSGTSVYVAGYFTGPTVSFGSTILTNTNAGPSGLSKEVFVAKLTDAGSTGSFTWAQRAGGTRDDQLSALAVSGASVYVAGYFGSPTADFGSITLTNAGGTPGATDVFVAKLTDVGSTGSFTWAQRAGGTGYDEANALTVSGSSIYVAGNVQSPTASFGATTLVNPNFNSLGFLASLTDPTPTATAAGRALVAAQLFPNPARRTVTLRLPAGTVPAPPTLTDAQGRAVRHYPAPARPETILDLRDLPAGLYLLRAPGLVQRLVVE